MPVTARPENGALRPFVRQTAAPLSPPWDTACRTLGPVSSPPIPIRAHSILCLLGFRGEGYSEAFVARMEDLHAVLEEDPEQTIELRAAPGTLCAVCPHHHRRAGCTLGGPDHEAHIRLQDAAVLARLGLEAGTVLPWREVLALVHTRLSGDDLPSLCTTCPWLALGWCAEGIDGLASARP